MNEAAEVVFVKGIITDSPASIRLDRSSGWHARDCWVSVSD